MQISRSIVLGLVAELRARGITRDQLLREADITATDLDNANVAFPIAYRAIRAGYRLTRDRALALHLGSRAPTHMLDVVGELLLHCSTIRGALSELDRYAGLIAPGSRFRLLEEGTRARLIHETTFADLEVTRVVSEIVMAFVVRIGRHYVADDARPFEMRFAYPTPVHAQAYVDTFGCPVHFDQPTTENVFSRAVLDEPQPFGDEPLRRLLKNRADELLSRCFEQRALLTRVMTLLEQQPDLSDVNMSVIARRLGMSESGLRRKLREEDSSWTSALDAARRDMALRALRNPEIPIKQIADQTGFSEPSAFHRAFRRWTGSTPAKFRAEATTLSLTAP